MNVAAPNFTSGAGYVVSSVRVTGVDGVRCAGKTVSVTLTDASDEVLASGSSPAAGARDSETITIPLDAGVAAAAVAAVHAAIA